MNIELKDFVAGALSIDEQEYILQELLNLSGNILNKDTFTEYLLKDMELVMEIIRNLTNLNQVENEEIQKLIAKYCLYCYSSGLVYGTTTCFNEVVGNTGL